jgi:hypothetical protein
MFSSQQYRARAAEYVELGKKSEAASEVREFEVLERSFTALADNEEWMEDNYRSMVHASDPAEVAAPPIAMAGVDDEALAIEDDHVLRCLGAAVIMQWSQIPTKLQRELFEGAGSMGDLLETKALRRTIARFLHKHKDDDR